MEKLVNKIMSCRGPEWRPFAIEVSQDDIRVAVFGGATGFAEPPTAETAPHQDIESCLLEAIELLEHSRLLSPNREPYHRLPHHRCVFLKPFSAPNRTVELRRRVLMRAVPRPGDRVRIAPGESFADEVFVRDVCWHIENDEVHLWDYVRELGSSDELDHRVAEHLEIGWDIAREYKLPPEKPHGP